MSEQKTDTSEQAKRTIEKISVELGREVGRKFRQTFKDVTGQTKREARQAELERRAAEKVQAETDMRVGLLTMTRCFHTSKIEGQDTPENTEEFARAAFIHYRGFRKSLNSVQLRTQTYNCVGIDVADSLLENGGITNQDWNKVKSIVSDIHVNYGGPARKQIYEYEEPISIKESLKWDEDAKAATAKYFKKAREVIAESRPNLNP